MGLEFVLLFTFWQGLSFCFHLGKSDFFDPRQWRSNFFVYFCQPAVQKKGKKMKPGSSFVLRVILGSVPISISIFLFMVIHVSVIFFLWVHYLLVRIMDLLFSSNQPTKKKTWTNVTYHAPSTACLLLRSFQYFIQLCLVHCLLLIGTDGLALQDCEILS